MISASEKSKRACNPVRNIIDNLNPPVNHPKPLINMALGDPTAYGNLLCPSVFSETIRELLLRNSANGYLPSTGLPAARKAIAAYNSSEGYTIPEDDIFIASGCSGALDLVLTGLLDGGDNVLVPKPNFPLYQVITESLGGHVKYYALKVSITDQAMINL